ncbi:MAG: hypothetical protein WAW96_20540 [Alphaproteobacteria bacterium]
MKYAALLISPVLIAGVCLALMPAPARAGSGDYDKAMARCQKFAEDNKVAAEPCECIAKTVSNDAALMKEDADMKTMSDFQNASKAYKNAVNPCLPPDQQAK